MPPPETMSRQEAMHYLLGSGGKPVRKRVAVINSTDLQFSYGGTSPFMRNLDPFLKEAYELHYFHVPAFLQKIDFLPRRLVFMIYLLFKRKELSRYDFIISHVPEGSYVISFSSVPYLHIFHGNFNPMSQSRFWFGKYFKGVFTAMEKRIIRTASIMYTVGNERDGIPKIFNPVHHRVSIKPIDERSGFIFAGRLEKIKNIDRIIRIYSKLPENIMREHALYIAGQGTQESNLRSLAESLRISDRIVFLGSLDNAELLEECSRHRLLLMASSQEGFPMAIAEALSLGLPVVTTDTGDIARFVKSNYNGFLLPLSFPDEAYIASIQSLLNEYATYSKQALASSVVFNADSVAKGLIRDIDKILTNQ
jgi:glycosyltransferase involved in cell wall biosynthesis